MPHSEGALLEFNQRDQSSTRTRHGQIHTSNLVVVEPPPFGVGSQRFNKHDLGASASAHSPAYHATAQDMTPNLRWNVKGWTCSDDAVKTGRGTSSGKVHSSMARPSACTAPGATLQPLTAVWPNETRLQELLDLHRRKAQTVPPPGAYDLPDLSRRRTTFRRPACPELDGPFLPEGETTRMKEIAATLVTKTAADNISPGDYDAGRGKDASSKVRSITSHKISSSARSGVTPHLKSLSISKSLQYGIDWHVPVIVQQATKSETMQDLSAGQTAQASHRNSSSSPRAAAGGGNMAHGDASGPGGSTRRYMKPLHGADSEQHMGLPPSAPRHISRSIRKQQARQPGAWDWQSLDFNWRNSWTTLHGGAYSQGHRPHLGARAVTAPSQLQSSVHGNVQQQNHNMQGGTQQQYLSTWQQQQQQQQGQCQVSGGYPSNMAMIGATLVGADMEPIAEETSTAVQQQITQPQLPSQGPSQGVQVTQSQHTHSDECQEELSQPRMAEYYEAVPQSRLGQSQQVMNSGTSAAVTVAAGHHQQIQPLDVELLEKQLVRPQDLARRLVAQQAASAVQQVSLRRSKWAEKCGTL